MPQLVRKIFNKHARYEHRKILIGEVKNDNVAFINKCWYYFESLVIFELKNDFDKLELLNFIETDKRKDLYSQKLMTNFKINTPVLIRGEEGQLVYVVCPNKTVQRYEEFLIKTDNLVK